jgi:hypothetical protein
MLLEEHSSVGPDLSGKASGLPKNIFSACTALFGDKSPPTGCVEVQGCATESELVHTHFR